MKSVLVAVGGNALVKENEPPTLEAQNRRAEAIGGLIADLVEDGHGVTVTHGNGPQVGFIMQRAERSARDSKSIQIPSLPLWLAVADSQGGIGHILANAISNTFRERGLDYPVVAVVTHCVVDAEDPAFNNPNKPIGMALAKQEAPTSWDTVELRGGMVRRVAPSPKPKTILESRAVATLMRNDQIVIAGGGGGIPLVENRGRLVPIDAVIDKDYTSALMAAQAEINTLILLTGVPNVVLNWGTEHESNILETSRTQMRKWLDDGQFPAGSMGPKIEAALSFLEGGGKQVIITNINTAAEAMRGNGGTHITEENL
ncbi:carbamate kinase [Actinomyces urinae]|uniref:carbamate kinase n=1 Tax=Actinomyces urinae TaxID=1689268 RepID=UPI000930C6EC|nr:carbamate kinase [Actinomyces urinae]